VTGAAPIAKEILEFFYACGVPVLEGYGMTETATVATSSTPEEHKFGTVGRPLPGVEVKIADDGEILIKGANIFRGYYKNDDASFGAVDEAGSTPATSARSTRTATSRSPAARRTSSSRRAARTSRRPTSRTTSSSRAGSRRR
jgi:acyl-CoA synthetase (AMP-forming)/AMP-acid ligase II